jgi:hypothetical protein
VGVAGLADVEASLLNAVLNPSNTSLPPSNAIGAQIWGIAVTKVFRDALQKVQGLTVGADSVAQMPSLSKPVIASLLTGNTRFWSSLTDGANNSITTAAVLGTVPAPADRNVWVARRPISSGTQTSIKVTLLNTPCASARDMNGPNATTCNVPDTGAVSPFFFQGQGTGNLLACLTTLNSVNKWAIGFASTSNKPITNFGTTSAADAGWRYIKVNGKAPTLLEGQTGRYELLTEGSLSYITSGQDANVQAVLDAMSAQLLDPTVLDNINSGAATQDYGSPLWNAGNLTPSGKGFTATYPLNDTNAKANPVAIVTRSFQSPNSCQPEVRFGQNAPVDVQ